MSLAVAQEMLARLEADAAGLLAAWAAQYGQERPRPMLGWAKPNSASDWPYLGLVATRQRRDYLSPTGDVDAAGVSLSAGVRLPTVERPAADGILAADALIQAALGTLSVPLLYSAGGLGLVLSTADHVGAELRHPLYEIEVSLSLTSPAP